MKKRLGPNVTYNASDAGFVPDFNINRRKQKPEKSTTGNLNEEEKQKLLEDMKKNADQLNKEKIIQVHKDHADYEKAGGKNYIVEMRKDVYSSTDKFNDLGDRVSRNIHYLARNLEEKNTFKR